MNHLKLYLMHFCAVYISHW